MNALTLVAPTDLRDFLKSHGWSLQSDLLSRGVYVLQNADFKYRQLIFPVSESAPDYAESVENVFQKLSELNGESPRRLLSDALSVRDDVIRLRVSSALIDDASIPLGFAAALVNNTEKLLKAAACTVIKPRAHHPRLSMSDAMQLVDKTRFQQTEKGSFVLRVACPVDSMDVQGSLKLANSEEPFVRQVTSSLHEALSQLTFAIMMDRESELVSSIKEAAAPVVSSNLCEAIAEMQDDRVNNSLDIGFDWAPAFPIFGQKRGTSDIVFARDYFPRIEEIRRELRAVELFQTETFIGTVERLEGDIDDDGRRSGAVVLSLLLREEGETVRARANLGADDYANADRAHMTPGVYIEVTGRLYPGRQPRQLTEITQFTLVGRGLLNYSGLGEFSG